MEMMPRVVKCFYELVELLRIQPPVFSDLLSSFRWVSHPFASQERNC